MKRNVQKVPGFDEIIFENRNRSYGAYDLRKRYRSAASLSLFGGVTIFSVPIILSFIFSPEPATAISESGVYVVVKPDNLIDPNKIAQPVVVKPASVPPKFKYVEPEVVEDTIAVSDFIIYDYAKDSVTNDAVTEVTDSVYYAPPATDVAEEPEPLIFVEEPPLFPGGKEALLKYIAENTKYPADAIENNIQGRVYVKFVVSADGTVKRAELLRGLHPSLDEEALRVVSSLPAWKPGRQNGQPVSVWFNVPVTFQIIIY